MAIGNRRVANVRNPAVNDYGGNRDAVVVPRSTTLGEILHIPRTANGEGAVIEGGGNVVDLGTAIPRLGVQACGA